MNPVQLIRSLTIIGALLTLSATAATTNQSPGTASTTGQVQAAADKGAVATAPVPDFIVPKIKAAEVCVEKMQLLVVQLTSLQASLTNQALRSDCVEKRLHKVAALYELSKSAPTRLAALTGDDDSELAEEEFQRVTLALARVESLVTEADDCLKLPLSPAKAPRGPSKATPPEPLAAPVRVPLSPDAIAAYTVQQAQPYVVRQPRQCLKQGELARLLAQAMSLSSSLTETMEAAISALTRLGIQPHGGWQELHAVNLDDFCVVVAQALRLGVAPTAPPRLSFQALREEGLPVDKIFPGYSGRDEAPLLLEAEVRRFFAIGLAAVTSAPGQSN